MANWGLIAEGDPVFEFASENEDGQGLIARGIVSHAEANRKKRGIARQTPRVSVTIKRTALAKRPMGRPELKHLTRLGMTAGLGLSSISNSISKQRLSTTIIGVARRAGTIHHSATLKCVLNEVAYRRHGTSPSGCVNCHECANTGGASLDSEYREYLRVAGRKPGIVLGCSARRHMQLL
jgi:hypothetical protein